MLELLPGSLDTSRFLFFFLNRVLTGMALGMNGRRYMIEELQLVVGKDMTWLSRRFGVEQMEHFKVWIKNINQGVFPWGCE